MKREIIIKFDGGDADKHYVDMKLLGQSLQGFDQIISSGIIFYIFKRPPKRRERAPVIVKANQPKVGSHEIEAVIEAAKILLPLAWPNLTDGSSNYLWHFVSYILKNNGGRKSEAKMHEDNLIEILSKQSEANERSQDAWREHVAEWRDQLFDLTKRLIPASVNAIAPIGSSVLSTSFTAGSAAPTLIDEPMADAIRSKGEIEISDLEQMDLQTDGFVHHSRRLNVVNPFKPGSYINAEIYDPLVHNAPNVYSEAANRKATIRAHVKVARRQDNIENIYIMIFVSEL